MVKIEVMFKVTGKAIRNCISFMITITVKL